ncbi:MAG: type II toxin-antitoxin system prevent-host-death family antitoxin [Mariprofundales bacterium]
MINKVKIIMNAINYTTVNNNLAEMMDKVCHEHTPVVITRNKDEDVVLISLEDFRAMEETAYLLRSPSNAQHLLAAIDELESGQGIERELLE